MMVRFFPSVQLRRPMEVMLSTNRLFRWLRRNRRVQLLLSTAYVTCAAAGYYTAFTGQVFGLEHLPRYPNWPQAEILMLVVRCTLLLVSSRLVVLTHRRLCADALNSARH